MNEEMLQPNCSEVVWRLNFKKALPIKEQIVKALQNKEDYSDNQNTWTDEYPNGCVQTMIELLEEAKEDGYKLNEIEWDYVDNEGGGGNSDFVEKCFDIAKQYMEKKITLKQALKKEDNLWNRGDSDAE